MTAFFLLCTHTHTPSTLRRLKVRRVVRGTPALWLRNTYPLQNQLRYIKTIHTCTYSILYACASLSSMRCSAMTPPFAYECINHSVCTVKDTAFTVCSHCLLKKLILWKVTVSEIKLKKQALDNHILADSLFVSLLPLV